MRLLRCAGREVGHGWDVHTLAAALKRPAMVGALQRPLTDLRPVITSRLGADIGPSRLAPCHASHATTPLLGANTCTGLGA
jgi:hypothetical protein